MRENKELLAEILLRKIKNEIEYLKGKTFPKELEINIIERTIDKIPTLELFLK